MAAPGEVVNPRERHICVTPDLDRKSTRLNSSHGYISYAVFCLKKKKNNTDDISALNTPNPIAALTPTLPSLLASGPPTPSSPPTILDPSHHVHVDALTANDPP